MPRPYPTTPCAALTTSGRPCRAWAIKGGTVCVKHGGTAPQVRAAARRRLEREAIVADLPRLLVAVEEGLAGSAPVETLDDARRRAAAVVAVLSEMLDGSALVVETEVGQRPSVALDLYRQWLDISSRISKMAADAGVDERLVRLQEADMALLARVVEGLMDAVLDRLADLGAGRPVIEAVATEWRPLARQALEAETTTDRRPEHDTEEEHDAA